MVGARLAEYLSANPLDDRAALVTMANTILFDLSRPKCLPRSSFPSGNTDTRCRRRIPIRRNQAKAPRRR
jgi:hypothetical protein